MPAASALAEKAADPAVLRTAETILLGGELLILLLTGYALLELGIFLLRRVRDQRCDGEMAKLIFGIPALASSLLPAIFAGYAVREKLFGLDTPMETSMVIVMSALLAGIVLESVALGVFFRKVAKAVAARQPSTDPSGSN